MPGWPGGKQTRPLLEKNAKFSVNIYILTNLLGNDNQKNIPFQEEILKRNSAEILGESWKTFGKTFQ